MPLDPRLKMSEQQLQATVIDTAQRLGWRVHHPRATTITRKDGTVRHATAISGNIGYPDLTLVRGMDFRERPGLIFAEIKTEKGRLQPAQIEWKDAIEEFIAAADALHEMFNDPGDRIFPQVGYRLWRPSDWYDGSIIKDLT